VAHHKIKPTTVLDYRKYKIGVNSSDQMMSYYLLERKMMKWWKKLFVHLFDLAVVVAHTLHTKTNNKKILLEICYENLLKDCSLVLVEKFNCKVRLAGRLIGRDYFLYRTPLTSYVGGKISPLMSRVCRERQMHQNILLKM